MCGRVTLDNYSREVPEAQQSYRDVPLAPNGRCGKVLFMPRIRVLIRNKMRYAPIVFAGLMFLNGARAGEVWKANQRLSETESIALLRTGLGNEVTGTPLRGVTFRDFHELEFYDLLRQADSSNKPMEAAPETWQIRVNFEEAIFERVMFKWLGMPQGRFNQASFTDVVFDSCDLKQAGFVRSQLIRCWFKNCNLVNASFNGENRASGGQSERRSDKPSEISFNESDLTLCDFKFSRMTRITFNRSYLLNSEMAWAKFDSTAYDPMPNSIPFIASFGSFEGLPDFYYVISPTGLTELRNAFKTAGLRKEERQITTALCRQQMRDGGRWEGQWKYLLFDLPSAFGMFPGRPLRILAGLCLILALPYASAILRQSKSGEKQSRTGKTGIWQVPLEKRAFLMIIQSPNFLTSISLSAAGFAVSSLPCGLGFSSASSVPSA
jgi:uncharacterized protein YjbI with pentapeptide repeats